ncbi:glutathione S-transferase family protein [Arenibaculum sp.]|jgi:GST-like protein|uniref:glutathione S-transferase family protein n=1 Tax=Arenibaculum sp. TaxID=2865862 RepID=UPI002E15DEA6|nr:glutathione binding-like protein [Arenibaculum sp.]
MITLYTSATPNGHKASVMLEELGLDYEVRTISVAEGQNLTPHYLEISPAGKIPALVETGADGTERRIFGSAAILQHLAEAHGRLLPTDPAQRAEALSWLSVATSDLGPAAVSLYRFAVLAPEKLPYAIDLFKRETERCWRAIETRLATSPHLAGPDYSIADIAAFPFAAAAARARPAFLDAWPNVKRWHDTIAARPAVQRGMAVPG